MELAILYSFWKEKGYFVREDHVSISWEMIWAYFEGNFGYFR